MFKQEEIWVLLDKYTFKTEADSELYCIICHKLLNNAHQGPCGCIYCKNCIELYIRRGNLYCPGKFYNCATVELEFGRNVIIDNNANRRISLLNVQCPLDSCSCTRKLMEMSNHLKICDKRLMLCPFTEMGCVADEMKNETMSNHLLMDINEHHQLMIEWIVNMKNDITSNIMNQQQELFNNQHMHIQHLTSSKIKEASETMLKLSSESLKDQIQQLQSKNSELKEIIKSVNNKVKRTSLILSNETDKKIDDLLKQNGEMMNELNRLRQEKDEMMNRYTEIDSVINIDREESSVRGAQLERCRIDTTTTTITSNLQQPITTRHSNEIGFSQSISSDLCLQMEKMGSLMWQFIGLSKIGRLPVESDKYYSMNHRYRMWLQLQNLGGHVDRIGVRLMINDGDKAIWPLNCVVVMSIRSMVASNFSKITWQRHLKYAGALGDISRSSLFTSHQFQFSRTELISLSNEVNNDSIMIECEIYTNQ